jgi:cytochrome P450
MEMSSFVPPTIYLSLLLLLPSSIYLILLLRPRRPSTLNFPPGPAPIPILGNLHQIPLQKSFLQFAQWSREYGPIIGLHLGPQKVVVLNSWQAVRDLLDQRGAIYSSRPDIPIVQHVLPGDVHLVFMKHDRTWRRARKTIVDFLAGADADRLLTVQDAESTQMVWELATAPEEYYAHVMRAFGAVILAEVYGLRGTKERTRRFFAIQDEWAALLDPGAMPPFEVFPFLRWVPDWMTPWRGWRTRAELLKGRQSGLYKELFEEAKGEIERGTGGETFVKKLLEDQEKEGYTDVELTYIAGFLMEGGADTTALALLTFIVAMAAYPEIQRRVQAEVDRVIGDEVMPASISSKTLPYLKACFWEVSLPMGSLSPCFSSTNLH